jgi:hypothetical protein
VTITIYIIQRYIATGFQHINKSIIGVTMSVYRLERLVVSGEKEGKGNV